MKNDNHARNVQVFGPARPTTLELRGIRFADGGGDGDGAGGDGDKGGKPKQEQTFTQAQVDAIVAQRLEQQAKNKFGDYDALKAKADGVKSVEDQLADLSEKLAATEARALRSEIASKHGISAEDRDLFLTGSDAASLEAQAKRLAEREADRKKKGNTAPNEGGTINNGGGDGDMREFTQKLFDRAN